MKDINQDQTTLKNIPIAKNLGNTVILNRRESQVSKAYTFAADTKVIAEDKFGGYGYERKIWSGECSLDHVEYQKKPSGKDAARITNRIGGNRVTVTEDELIDAIVFHGRSWSPSIFSQAKRCTETFIGMNALVLDFDKGFENLAEILERADVNNLKFSFFHESFSHTSERPKYRGVILLKDLLEDIGDAKIYLHYLKEIFVGFVDNSAAEPIRFFYGGKGLVFHNPRHYYSVDQFKRKIGTDRYFKILNKLAKKGQYTPRNKIDRASIDYEDTNAAREFLKSETIPPREKQRLIQELLIAKNAISEFPPGRNMHRYNLLFNYSMALGKLSQIPLALSYDTLVKAAKSNDYFALHWKYDIESVVKSGLEFGVSIREQ